MSTFLIILIIIILIILVFEKKYKFIWILIIPSLFLLQPLGFLLMDIYNRNFKDDGYGDDLEPISSEIKNITNYKKAALMMVNNWKRINTQIVKDDQQILEEVLHNERESTPSELIDSMITIQKDSFNLRFIAYPGNCKITEKDTIIEFKADQSDYNMVSNDANELYEIPPYSIYKHSIIFSTVPIKTSIYISHIKNNFYYKIDEYDEW
ncbi:hypothetical protein [Aquimarina algicola]|uniref:Uncharacterized protein n=1 Tax=Aquimarina algicola TaxID=2589995 RepID=A0A504JGK3_9FLAO|nr:hypothetical protein [Aquimarina algicola]TPN86898.1 hypothetical protein FHK87_04665 [Aquimarina algicola]